MQNSCCSHKRIITYPNPHPYLIAWYLRLYVKIASQKIYSSITPHSPTKFDSLNWGVHTPFVVFRHTRVYDGLSHNVFLLLFWLIITVVIPCVPLLDWSMELNIVFTVLLLIISHHIRIMSYHVPMISPLFFYPQIWWWITIFRNDHFGVPLFSDSSNWMFHYKPSSYWGSLISGACSISHLISHQVFPMVFLMRYGFPMVSLWFSLWFSHLMSEKKRGTARTSL